MKSTIFVLFFFLAVNLEAKILTIYSDVGISGNDVWIWTDGGSFDRDNTDLTPPEGTKCYKTICNGTYAGWGVVYFTAQNFSEYSGGDLRFWIYTSTGKIKVEVQDSGGTKGPLYITQYGWTDADKNTWKMIKIPLSDFSGFNIAVTTYPFMITTEAPATFYVDLVRWTTNVALPDVQLRIKDVQTHIEKSSITFSRVNLIGLPTGWVTADQYIELEVDIDTTSWGIQIYTDNKATDANPQFTGSGDPCGLIDITTTTKRLPLSWTIEDSTKTFSQLGTGAPETWVSDGFQWKWMKDKNTNGFTNGENYVTVWDNVGLLWDSSNRAWKNSPNYIYLSADFSNALTPRQYRTNTLRIEFFHK